jgi:hypothetical protein
MADPGLKPVYEVGDRVYYVETGPVDVGTVTEVVTRSQRVRKAGAESRVIGYAYRVVWDINNYVDGGDAYSAKQINRVEPEAEFEPVDRLSAVHASHDRIG